MNTSDLPNQFYVNATLVDIETGEITTEGKTLVLEPKVMALLQVLVKAPRQVISAQSLFESVWPQAIYSPNSVRRNIALLRQALSDEDKSVIKTHPKRGYSLEAQVHFPEQNTPALVEASTQKKSFKAAMVLIPLVFIVALFSQFYGSNDSTALVNLRPLTASNEQERYMQVSPDGRFMAYIRTTKQPNNRRLFIKDLTTNTQSALTATEQAFTYLAWDNQTNALVYSVKNEKGISFARLHLDTQAQVVREELLFTRTDISWNSLFFIDKHQNLYYLANQNSSEHSRNVSLFKHNIATGRSEQLLKPNDNFKPYKLALSPDQVHLALIGFNEQAVSEVKLLNIETNNIKPIRTIDQNWHFMTWFETGERLLLSNGSELKQLDVSGELANLNFKSFNFLLYPQVVKNKVYFIEAKSDQDILISDLAKLSPPKKLINSNTVDIDGTLSPDQKQVAYMSMKNGWPQLFVTDIETGKEQMLFANDQQEFALTKPVWHHSGKRITSSINNKPFIIQLGQGLTSTEWQPSVIGVPLAWYKNSDAILIVDKSTHNDELIKLNLVTKHITPLEVQLARNLVYLNHKDQLMSFANGKVIQGKSTELTLINSGEITDVYPASNGFYFQLLRDGKPLLKFYDYELGVQNLNAEAEQFCEAYCSQITAVGENIMLLKEQSNSADVLVLDIAEND